MNKKLLLASTTVAGMAVLGSYGRVALSQARTGNTEEITIKFSAMVGDKPFSCGSSYTNLGKPGTTATASDFRFYISEVALIDEDGKAVPLKLTQDGKWQHQGVALLDFENKSATCTNGTTEIRDRIIGTVPKGKYKGLQFTLGVSFNLNHEDATLAPSPLNLTSLWWNWRGGYKFLRVDLKQQMNASTNHKSGAGHGATQGFPIHIGSTGCKAEGDNQKPSSCSNPNTVKVTFTNFDANKNVVVADLATLLANTNLTMNQPNTPVGCMSAPNDKDCAGIMQSLGLSFDGKSSLGQTFFKVK
jgi:uncharacterized repeat protein (TIGR04052 family)